MYETQSYGVLWLKYYFQQDGVALHKANIVQECFKSKFGGKFINKKKWPPRSPDLNICDFFLLGYLYHLIIKKRKVYHIKNRSIYKFENVLCVMLWNNFFFEKGKLTDFCVIKICVLRINHMCYIRRIKIDSKSEKPNVLNFLIFYVYYFIIILAKI